MILAVKFLTLDHTNASFFVICHVKLMESL